VLAATAMAAVAVPAVAAAANVQVGVTKSALIAPTCPADAQGNKCTILLTQVTAYETLGDGVADPDTIKQSGVISSFTLGLTSTQTITPAIMATEDQKYGGQPEAQLTALIPTGTAASPSYRVVAQSEARSSR
jgi:hypothetical protein